MNDENTQQESAGFDLPADYFGSSAEALQNRLQWLEEHREFPALRMAWRETGFQTPENYFEQLDNHLEVLPYQKLQARKRETGFSCPEDYFETAAAHPIYTIVANTAPSTGFEVPEDYLNIPVNVSDQAIAPKIISLPLKIARYAAAAALLLSMGWWFYSKDAAPLLPKDCGGLACVDRKEIMTDKTIEFLEEEDLNVLVDPMALEKALTTKPISRPEDSLSECDEPFDNL